MFQELTKNEERIVRKNLPQNRTGIPVRLKERFERGSGFSLEDVRVHYRSDEPAKLGALAYTQGSHVYLGTGQERFLSHELGHVIQQKRGNVPPRGSINGAGINDDPRLEREADKMAEELERAKLPEQADSPFARELPEQADISAAREMSAGAGFRESTRRGGRPVIQRKGVAGVTLSMVQNIRLPAKSVCVDTLTFGDRFDTGLKKKVMKNGREVLLKSGKPQLADVEGDHTIADVFVKKYQKDYLKEKNLAEALNFYGNLAGEILGDAPPERFAGDIEGFMEKRYHESQDLAHKTIQYVNFAESKSGEGFLLKEWNVLFKDVVESYNRAYAKSLLSTQGKGTGGHGEGTSVKALKRVKHSAPEGVSPEDLRRIESLIDLGSVNTLQQPDVLGQYRTIAGIPLKEAEALLGKPAVYQTSGRDVLRRADPNIFYAGVQDAVKVRFDVMKNAAIDSRRRNHERYDCKRQLQLALAEFSKEEEAAAVIGQIAERRRIPEDRVGRPHLIAAALSNELAGYEDGLKRLSDIYEEIEDDLWKCFDPEEGFAVENILPIADKIERAKLYLDELEGRFTGSAGREPGFFQIFPQYGEFLGRYFNGLRIQKQRLSELFDAPEGGLSLWEYAADLAHTVREVDSLNMGERLSTGDYGELAERLAPHDEKIWTALKYGKEAEGIMNVIYEHIEAAMQEDKKVREWLHDAGTQLLGDLEKHMAGS